MAKEKDPAIAGYECKQVTYSTSLDGKHDLCTIKEVVHYNDGRAPKPQLRLIADFKRPFWITKEGWRNHKDKKEWEDVSKLMKFESTQVDLPNNILKALGKVPGGKFNSLRMVCRSPYVYGADLTPPVLIKHHYMKTWPEFNTGGAKETMYNVCMYDIETDMVKGTEEIIMASVAMGKYVELFVTEDYLGTEAATYEKRIRAGFDKYIREHIDKRVKAVNESGETVEKIVPRDVDLKVTIVKDAGELAYQSIQRVHELMPDIMAIWNMDFDIPKVMKALEKAGYDLGDVFSDPNIPRPFRKYIYAPGQSQKVTQAGKTMPLPYFDRWHSVIAPMSFQVIDAMCLYRKLRFAKGMEDGYSLDAVLGRNLGIRKLKFTEANHLVGGLWHAFMQEKYPVEYGVYNIFDTMSMQLLDEKVKDMCQQLAMHSGHSEWSKFPSQPRRTWDDLNFDRLENDQVAATTSDQMRTEHDEMTVDLGGWIVTLPSHLTAGTGLKCILEVPDWPSFIWAFVGDLDITATYPTVEQIANISRETTVAEIIAIQGLDEHSRRAVGINLTSGFVNAVEITIRVYQAPTFESMLAAFDGHEGEVEDTGWYDDGSGNEEEDYEGSATM